MKGGEGYNKFLKHIEKNLFKYRFDRSSPEKKRGITIDEAEHLIKIFLLAQNKDQLTSRQIQKLVNAEIIRLKQILNKLERSPSHKYLPILRKKRKSPHYTIKRQRSLQAHKPRYFDEKRYYMTRLKRKKRTKKNIKRSLHHCLSPSEKWGTV